MRSMSYGFFVIFFVILSIREFKESIDESGLPVVHMSDNGDILCDQLQSLASCCCSSC